MPVDWNEFSQALKLSRDGQNLKALVKISELLHDAESDIDRTALVLGQVTCYAHLGDTAKCAELLDLARTYAHQDRLALSQVALSTASLHAQMREFEIACEKYMRIKAEYQDLLTQSDHEDFAIELDSRLACTLVDAQRYCDAVPVFRGLLQRSALEDKQRLQVFFGFALFRTGQTAESQLILFEAAKGEDRKLAQVALDYLTEMEKGQEQQCD